MLGPQDPSARALAQFAGARSERLPGVLVVADQLVSSLRPVYTSAASFPAHMWSMKTAGMPLSHCSVGDS